MHPHPFFKATEAEGPLPAMANGDVATSRKPNSRQMRYGDVHYITGQRGYNED
jgi:hypothetical protein